MLALPLAALRADECIHGARLEESASRSIFLGVDAHTVADVNFVRVEEAYRIGRSLLISLGQTSFVEAQQPILIGATVGSNCCVATVDAPGLRFGVLALPREGF